MTAAVATDWPVIRGGKGPMARTLGAGPPPGGAQPSRYAGRSLENKAGFPFKVVAFLKVAQWARRHAAVELAAFRERPGEDGPGGKAAVVRKHCALEEQAARPDYGVATHGHRRRLLPAGGKIDVVGQDLRAVTRDRSELPDRHEIGTVNEVPMGNRGVGEQAEAGAAPA